MKAKQLTRSKAKARAWKAFSLYTRTNGSKGGFGKCITCERTYPVTGRGTLQAGHFIPGRHNAILFDERNCHPQCYGCNVMKKGNMVKYYKFMLEKYGAQTIADLEELDNSTLIYSVDDFLLIEKTYTDKLANLTNN